jgi:hypothetical protein
MLVNSGGGRPSRRPYPQFRQGSSANRLRLAGKFGAHGSDCVLSLNRRYDAFTLPRVKAFAEHHPEVTTLAHLNAMFAKYPEIGQFSRDALNYNDVRRERTLRGVADYLLTIGPSYAGATEWERLTAWAQSARPADSASIGVKGFGLAGFQYLRMLLGAQTRTRS